MPTFKKGFADRLQESRRFGDTSTTARNFMRIPIRANYEALRIPFYVIKTN